MRNWGLRFLKGDAITACRLRKWISQCCGTHSAHRCA
uniref:Uncharacterized protein n=1 Tax=Anguilla anguilla TaxID=7936 RepID=A0A0E9TYC7_ANGAN